MWLGEYGWNIGWNVIKPDEAWWQIISGVSTCQTCKLARPRGQLPSHYGLLSWCCDFHEFGSISLATSCKLKVFYVIHAVPECGYTVTTVRSPIYLLFLYIFFFVIMMSWCCILNGDYQTIIFTDCSVRWSSHSWKHGLPIVESARFHQHCTKLVCLQETSKCYIVLLKLLWPWGFKVLATVPCNTAEWPKTCMSMQIDKTQGY